MTAKTVKKAETAAEKKLRRQKNRTLFINNIDLYLLLLPALVYLFIFKYIPMGGLVIAFQNYNIFKGITGSEWVGFANFAKLFTYDEFYKILGNTLAISVTKIVLLFPAPIAIALFLNEIRSLTLKKTIQTVIYFPYFLSWIIVAGIFFNILSTSGGLLNNLIVKLGGQPVPFLYDNRYFRWVIILSHGWKTVGWNSIVFIAAIAGIDQELYEAAEVDGASRFRRMISITLPSMVPTIIMMFILTIGHILDAGTEHILTMYNPLVYDTADVIGTYVYRMGIGKMDYSFSAAVGMFESLVGLVLVLTANYLSRKWTEHSIW